MKAALIRKNINLRPEETVIKILRPAGRILILTLSWPLIIISADFFFLYPLFYQGKAGMIIFNLVLLVGLIWLARRLISWYLTILIITNQRLVDIDRPKLLTKTVSEIPLAQVAEVIFRVRGLTQTLNRLGDIYISLTDSQTKILVRQVAQAQKIQQLILRLKAEQAASRVHLAPSAVNNLLD